MTILAVVPKLESRDAVNMRQFQVTPFLDAAATEAAVWPPIVHEIVVANLPVTIGTITSLVLSAVPMFFDVNVCVVTDVFCPSLSQ